MSIQPGKFPEKADIEAASLRIAEYVHRTPVMTSAFFNSLTKAEIFFKCENFQKVGAFKSRGACNAVLSLSQQELSLGVCTHSSGNHAQALARAAKLLKIKAHIVMPSNSSRVKVDAVKGYGGIVYFCEPTLEARETKLAEVMQSTNAIEIHPYNNYHIISGQATAAKELFEEVSGLDFIMAPVGGGGLLSGTALATHYFSPTTKVIAAEPETADDAFRSFKDKVFYPSENPQTMADGLRTSLGSLTFPIILQHVTEILTVSEASISETMRLCWERMKIIIEPSSAVPLAAVLHNLPHFAGKRVGIILSGGNAELDNLPWNQKP